MNEHSKRKIARVNAYAKKGSSALEWIGVVLIAAGIVIGPTVMLLTDHSDEIETAVKANILEYYLSSESDLEINYSTEDAKKYEVTLELSPQDKSQFLQPSQCGLVGIEFLQNIKQNNPTEDGYVYEYHLEFLADGEVAYSAVYVNATTTDGEITLALSDGTTLYEAKPYAEYLAEAQAAEQTSAGMDIEGEIDQTQTGDTGELSYTLVEDADGDIQILPSSEQYRVRNADSTLYQYEHDYCADYFLLSNVTMSDSRSDASVDVTFTNTSDVTYSSVFVYCDFMDADGVVIDQDSEYISNATPGRSYNITLEEYSYSGESEAVSFRIASISVYYDGGGNQFTFD